MESAIPLAEAEREGRREGGRRRSDGRTAASKRDRIAVGSLPPSVESESQRLRQRCDDGGLGFGSPAPRRQLAITYFVVTVVIITVIATIIAIIEPEAQAVPESRRRP